MGKPAVPSGPVNPSPANGSHPLGSQVAHANNTMSTDSKSGLRHMNLQLTQPQFNSQRDFHETPEKSYPYMAPFGTSQANVQKAGTQKIFPSKAGILIEQVDVDQ